jgi:hypothetical protein
MVVGVMSEHCGFDKFVWQNKAPPKVQLFG